MPSARPADSGGLGAQPPAGSRGGAPVGVRGAKPPGKFLKNKGVLEALRAILSIETSRKLMSNLHEK